MILHVARMYYLCYFITTCPFKISQCSSPIPVLSIPFFVGVLKLEMRIRHRFIYETLRPIRTLEGAEFLKAYLDILLGTPYAVAYDL